MDRFQVKLFFLFIIRSLTTLALSPPPTNVDLIVIGAGWSGMGAADHLIRSKFTNILILEGSNRTGGRTEAIKFGKESVGRVMVEVGSNWISGIPHSGGPSGKRNPVYQQALKVQETGKFKLTLIPGGTQNMSNYIAVYDNNGSRVDLDGSIRKHANDVYDCMNRSARHGGKDVTIREAATKCGWNPKTEAESAVDWGLTVDDPGVDAKIQSLQMTLPDETYEWWGDGDYFVLDQNPRGYAHLLDSLTADTLPPTDARIHYNTIVKQIDYTCTSGASNCVKVTSADGRVFTAKHVISTLPLGVMQRNYASLFVPPMPSKQVNVLTSEYLIMSNLSKVFIQFAKPFWDPTIARFLASDPETGSFIEWHNMDHVDHIPGSKTLFAWLGEPQSSIYDSRPDAEVQAVVMKKLQRLYPGKVIGEPTDFYITRHSINPLRYGAYSAQLFGWKDHEENQLIKPLKDSSGSKRVYFAGEHTCDDLSGFTHGALISGREAAATFLKEEHNGPDFVYMCDE